MPTPFRLYYWFQPGCPSCMAAKPHLDKFIKAHPEALKLDINARTHGAPIAGVKAKATPTYQIIPNGETRGVVHEGPLTEKQLEEFLREATTGEEPEEDSEDAYEPEEEEDDEE